MKTVITGAASGLGAQLARQLSELGWELHLIDVDDKRLAGVADSINSKAYVCDVSDRLAVREVMSEIGDIQVLVCAAAKWTDEEYEQEHPDARKAAIDANVLGLVESTKAALEHMDKQAFGRILVISSTGGIGDSRGSLDDSAWQTYSATKWAATGFARALRHSLEGTKIQVQTMYPGGFESNFYEDARGPDLAHNQDWMMSTEEVATVAQQLLTQPESVYMEKVVFTKA